MIAKICTKCGELKPLTDFCKDRAKGDGHQTYCRECNKLHCKKYKDTHKTDCAKRRKNWRKTKPGKKARRRWQLKRKYGLTLDEHRLMYILQNGRCKICGEHVDYDKIKTDHCHRSGKVRGLLCNRCNFLLAAIDDKMFFDNALRYLEL